MRPRKLVVEGLRSFRNRVEIDFGDRHLVAIVGDTGVGKSSILEAITYALYGGTTWTDRHGDLIRDTADDMLVELTFDVDGNNYTVTRTASRKSRPSTAQLQGPDGTLVDDVRPVNAAVVKLVGLDREAFLKTVILPQGKFAELLHATPGERNEVLKGIFRVDVLEAVSEYAKASGDRLSPHVQGLQQRRAVFPPDPGAALEEARRAEDETAASADHLAQLLSAAEGHDKSRVDAQHAAEAVRQALARLDAEAAPQLSQRIQALLGRANELDTERQSLESQKAHVKGQLSELEDRRREATADGLDTAGLATAHTTVSHIANELPAVAETVGRLRESELELAGLVGHLDPLCEKAEEAQREAERAAEAADRANKDRREAEQAMNGAEKLLGRARIAASRASEADEAVTAFTTKHDKAFERRQEAERLAEEPRRRHQAAQSSLEHLRRQHAAAHASQGTGPGDPCPVCTRELPSDFCAPLAPAMEAAIADAEEAEEELKKAREEVVRAGQMGEGAEERLSEAIVERSRRQAELVQAVDDLARHLQVAVTGIDLAADDEAVLASLRDVLAEAEETETKSAEAAKSADEVAREAWDNERRMREQLQTKRRWLDETCDSAKKRLLRLADTGSRLPDPLRLPLPRPDELETAEVGAFDPRPFDTLAEALQDRLQQLQDLDQRLQAARDSDEECRNALAGLEKRYATDVAGPAVAVGNEIVLLSERAAQAAASLNVTFEAHALSVDADLPRLAAAVAELSQRQDGLLAYGRETAEGYDSASREAVSKLQAVLDEARADDVDALRERAVDAEVAARTAEQRLLEAKDAAEQAEMLDRQLALGKRLVDDLERLRDHLGKGQKGFIAHLISRRAEALLGVAGHHLSEMTGGRYAFMADFEILDQLTGLPRHAKTLSGGESFLASLALALGMVDLAARAGGRLDALFLDEGFGALDATNLDAAIDALEATAQSGRMVGVISHVRAVAERIDDVLVVKAAPDGSRVCWLDDPQRAGLTQKDATAALAGLLD
ncbi:MAG: SMC family ATPase [Actinomycetota bacterium]|nr:SMC family ATPase [Actinomycetota bacterium]